ncbi:hypothetical protein B0H14DRAFT_456235 [Mycena olivaceomarginata]|nr:hypothetical protein B0H14DRAFT_456235 [Mycena olivaceomarginata]
MQIPSFQASYLRRVWTYARPATSVSYPSAIDTPSRTTPAGKDGIPLMLSKRAYPGDYRCARSARAPPDACAYITPCHHLHHLLRAQRARSSFPIAVAAFIASSRAGWVSCKIHTRAGRILNMARTTTRVRSTCGPRPPPPCLAPHYFFSKPAPVQYREYDAQHRRSAQQVQRAFPFAHAAFIVSLCAAPILCAHAALRSKPRPATHRERDCNAPGIPLCGHPPPPSPLPTSILSAIPPRWLTTPPHRCSCAVRRAAASHHQRRPHLPR